MAATPGHAPGALAHLAAPHHAPPPRCRTRRTEPFRASVAARTFVCASLNEWRADEDVPHCTVRAGVGRAGDIEGGTAALLAASAVRTEEFSPAVLECLPPTPWRVTGADLAERRDLRWVAGAAGVGWAGGGVAGEELAGGLLPRARPAR